MAQKKKRVTKTKTKAKKAPVKKRAKARAKKKVGKIQSAKENLAQRLDGVNRVINRFETEVETLVKKFVKQGERSRKDLRKNFDGILKKVRGGKIIARTRQTREELEKEVRRLADEVIGTVKDVESLLNHEKVTGIFDNARQSLANIIELFVENGLILQAKQTVLNTRKEVLGLLSIPTQGEVEKLERKIVSLERRLSTLTRKAA